MGSPRENVANIPYLVQTGQGVNIQRLTWWRKAWTAAEASADTATCIHAAVTLKDAETQDISTNITQPTCARCLSITGGKAEEVGIVTIYGTNINDDPISEALTLNGVTLVPGTKAFKTVTHILYPARTQATTPTVTVGDTDILGLPIIIPAAACLYATYVNGSLEGTAATVTVDADEIEKNTIDPNSSLAGTAVIAIGYIYN